MKKILLLLALVGINLNLVANETVTVTRRGWFNGIQQATTQAQQQYPALGNAMSRGVTSNAVTANAVATANNANSGNPVTNRWARFKQWRQQNPNATRQQMRDAVTNAGKNARATAGK